MSIISNIFFHLSTASCGPPPRVRNALIFGKIRQRYETNAVVRYHCAAGFRQRLSPLVRCLSGGVWEKPKILCINGKKFQNKTVTVNFFISFKNALVPFPNRTHVVDTYGFVL